ncbi:glycosyltransferase family 2 protein [Lichenihabitans psoromatis]|uniref:glycosyltransferase family 2 protein n=1 Tax=Lichenihabitans psoromatis TaxID=2528642 RepID=UPI0010385A95|nr:glycosyltransferase [Lichenihabitans psoromatis]
MIDPAPPTGSSRPFAIGFATIDRPFVVQRLILSIRSLFPDAVIYVADQSLPTIPMQDFYASRGVEVLWMDYDCGVTVARNAIVDRCAEDYLVICDDDFILTPDTSFGGAFTILDHDPEIGLVGGRLIDISQDETQRVNRYWELFLEHDQRNRILFSIPIYLAQPVGRSRAGVDYFLVDAVMNWFVVRKALFSAKMRWDPRFKSNGEHEDFFLTLKRFSPLRVAYLPTMVADHHHPRVSGYKTLRDRQAGWQLFLEKWDLDQMIEVGGGARTRSDVSREYVRKYDKASFFGSLPLRRDRGALGLNHAVDLTDEGQVVVRHKFTAAGAALPLGGVDAVRGADDPAAIMLDSGQTERRVGERRGHPKPMPPRPVNPTRTSAYDPLRHVLHVAYPEVVPVGHGVTIWVKATGATRPVEATLQAVWHHAGAVIDPSSQPVRAIVPPDTHWYAVHVNAPPLPRSGPFTLQLIAACGDTPAIVVAICFIDMRDIDRPVAPLLLLAAVPFDADTIARLIASPALTGIEVAPRWSLDVTTIGHETVLRASIHTHDLSPTHLWRRLVLATGGPQPWPLVSIPIHAIFDQHQVAIPVSPHLIARGMPHWRLIGASGECVSLAP